jgi:hypothetical protein
MTVTGGLTMKDEWVLIVDAEFGPDYEVRSGRVAAHSPDRDEVRRRAIELQPASSTVRFTGELKFDGVYCISAWGVNDPLAAPPEAGRVEGTP